MSALENHDQSFAYHTHNLTTTILKQEIYVGSAFTWNDGKIVLKISDDIKSGQTITFKKISE